MILLTVCRYGGGLGGRAGEGEPGSRGTSHVGSILPQQRSSAARNRAAGIENWKMVIAMIEEWKCNASNVLQPGQLGILCPLK